MASILKRMLCPHLMKRTSQHIDALHRKTVAVPTCQRDRKEPRSSWHARSAEVNHGLSNMPPLASSNDAVRTSPHPSALLASETLLRDPSL